MFVKAVVFGLRDHQVPSGEWEKFFGKERIIFVRTETLLPELIPSYEEVSGISDLLWKLWQKNIAPGIALYISDDEETLHLAHERGLLTAAVPPARSAEWIDYVLPPRPDFHSIKGAVYSVEEKYKERARRERITPPVGSSEK